ncbi:helix-turn-helix transcriptional regulator [Oscillospiraceae bacterium 50-58]
MQAKKPTNVRVGRNIQRLREEHHYTQEELSEKIGVTPNHLSAIERGVSGISLELLEKLCQMLSVTADHILFGRKTPETNGEELLKLLQSIGQVQTEIARLWQAIDTLTEQLNHLHK